jgi:hypothetical protein
MQVLFKNVSVELVSTFHAKSFFLYDIILLTDKHDPLFTVNDKPYVNKESNLSAFLSKVYKGDWEPLFLDLFNYKPNADGRLLTLFLSDEDYVTFVGKFICSVFPELSVAHKARLIQAVCDDTRYVKSGVFMERAGAYLNFNPSQEQVMEAAKQEACKLPDGFADHLRFDWVVGHHWGDQARFFPKVIKNIRSISFQEFRSIVFNDLPGARGLFAFSTERPLRDVMSDAVLAPSFDSSFESKSYYSDPEGSDVKSFIEKYGVSWIRELSKDMAVGADYLQKFPVELMVDENEMVAIASSPEKMEEWFRRLVLNSSFRQSLNFPLLAEWVKLRREGVSVKTA